VPDHGLAEPSPALAERRCWFEDTDPAAKRVREYTAAQTRLEGDPVPTRGIATVRYFVSYAHKDQADVCRLMEQLESRLARVRDYRFERLLDTDGLVPGERIEREVRKMIDSCHFGLQRLQQKPRAAAVHVSGGETREKTPGLPYRAR